MHFFLKHHLQNSPHRCRAFRSKVRPRRTLSTTIPASRLRRVGTRYNYELKKCTIRGL